MTQSPVAPSRTKCPRCRALAWQKDGDISCLTCGTVHIPTITVEQIEQDFAPLPGRSIARTAALGGFRPGTGSDGCSVARSCLACPLDECSLGDERGGVRCVFDGCARTGYIDGLCSAHYRVMMREARLQKRPPLVCSEKGCGGAHHGRGLCRVHYEKAVRRGGELPPRVPRRRPEPRPCPVDGCDRTMTCRGLCNRHYKAAQRIARKRG